MKATYHMNSASPNRAIGVQVRVGGGTKMLKSLCEIIINNMFTIIRSIVYDY